MIALSLDWGSVWTVTFMGFGLVFFILLLLIFILQGFGLLFSEKKAKPAVAEAPKPEVKATKAAPAAGADDDTAAIAMALHLYYNAVHDMQSYELTLNNTKPTAWNSKMYAMNNVGF